MKPIEQNTGDPAMFGFLRADSPQSLSRLVEDKQISGEHTHVSFIFAVIDRARESAIPIVFFDDPVGAGKVLVESAFRAWMKQDFMGGGIC